MSGKVKVGYVLEKKNVTLVRVLAKNLGVTQSEVISCLVEMAKDGIFNGMVNKMADKLERRAKRLRRMANPESSRKEER